MSKRPGYVVPFCQELMKLSEQYKLPIIVRACDTMGYGVNFPGAVIPRSVQGIIYAIHTHAGVPHEWIEWHGHNDFYKAVNNSTTAWLYGASGVNCSLFGIGERTGNTPLEAMVFEYAQLKGDLNGMDTTVITELAEYYQNVIGYDIPPRTPFVGKNFNVTRAGVHADGDNKAGLYSNALAPERFGRRREYALGKNSGKANILRNLKELGFELTPEQTRRVTDRIIELGDKKELVTQDDLPYIVSDVLKHNVVADKVKLISYMVCTSYGLKPLASIKVEINGQQYAGDATGDGQYDAFVKALRRVYKENLNKTFPVLTNYSVTIPPGGRTDALVQTTISWHHGGKLIRTRGLDADQTEAAIKATIKMLNMFETENDENLKC